MEEGQGETGGDGGGGERGTGCHHYAPDNRMVLIDDLILTAIGNVLRSFGTEVHGPSSSLDEYLENSLLEVAKETKLSLLSSFASIDNLHWHEIKAMENVIHHQYLLDVQHDSSICHDSEICPAIRRGDVLLLEEDPDAVTISSEKGISLLVAIGDEDEFFRSAVHVQLVEIQGIPIHYTAAAYLGINIQDLIEAWLLGHATVEKSDTCIINTTLQIPNQTQRCDCAFNSLDASIINHLNDNQKEIIDDISRSLSCLHMNHIELINGAGPGRIQLLSSLLVMLMDRLRIVVYAPSARDIIGLLNGVYDLCFSTNKLKLFCENIICFERNSDMGIYDDICLERQIETAQKFFGCPGWKFFINLTVQILEHFTGHLFKIEFMQASNQLIECIRYLQSKVSCFGMNSDKTKELIMAMKEINDIIGRPDDISSLNASIGDLDKKKTHCVNMLKELKDMLSSLLLPTFNNRFEAKEFCIRNSRLIFCSVNSGFHLNDMNHPIDCLVIDSADLLKEVNTLVPLCLPSLQSIVLAGHNQELQENELFPTLFGRLSCLGFKKHFLLQHDQPEIPSRHLVRTARDQPKLLQTEFSWIERPLNTKIILAPVRDQGKEETCALHSTMATTESLYKIHHASQHPPQNFNFILDIQDMKLQYKIETGYEFGEEPKGNRGWSRVRAALNCLMNIGVMGIDESGSAEKVKRIKISSFQEIVPTRDFDQVREHLHGGNILVGSFRLSYNFFELSPGEVYHYDPNRPVLSGKTPLNHAIMFVGYGGPSREVVTKDATNLAAKQAPNLQQEESDVPHLVYQNSYGRLFGFGGGFGRVGLASIKNLALVTI